jgi:hypothetical protein
MTVISELPDEIIHLICSKLPRPLSVRTLSARMVVAGNRRTAETTRLVAALRIQLWCLFRLRCSQLRIYICANLSRMFAQPSLAALNFHPGMGHAEPIDWRQPHNFERGLDGLRSVPSGCIYYAPFVPGGVCRSCMGNASSHPFTEKLIMRYLR